MQLTKTRGIVLYVLPYSDTYSIVHIYTEEFGKTPVLAAGNRGKKSRVSKTLFIPLSIHEMEIEWLASRDIQRIRESRLCIPLQQILIDPVKNVIALFLSEFIFRTIKESEPDTRLFDFLFKSVCLLESIEKGAANFHLTFLIRMLDCLGLSPQASTYSEGSVFDMRDGIFTLRPLAHINCLTKEDSKMLNSLLRISYENMSLYTFSRHERVLILNRILDYYRIHLPHITEIKSLAVLQSVFE